MKLYWAMVLPVLIYGSECWTLRKEDERRLLMAVEMVWLRRIRGRSSRERIRNEKTRGELGAEEMVIEKKTYIVWTLGKDGRKKTTKCSTAWAWERRKKQRKTKEEMDGQ